jgi:hypothetical protein
MEEKNEWVFFKEIDWNCEKNNRFNVDTRDFHCGYLFSKEEHKDWEKISKHDRFFFTESELKEQLERLFTESGGEGEWRFLSLVSNDKRVLDWNLKYLRIFRTERGFIICNEDNRAIPKDILTAEVNQELLNHY